MKGIGVEGVIRGEKPRTTIADKALHCPLDRMNRQFHAPAPNVLWVGDFAYVATWQGFVYVAFAINVFARRVFDWRLSRTASAGFVLDALEKFIHKHRFSQKKDSSFRSRIVIIID
jgi:putative transposase